MNCGIHLEDEVSMNVKHSLLRGLRKAARVVTIDNKIYSVHSGIQIPTERVRIGKKGVSDFYSIQSIIHPISLALP
jgi:hypothetical protein